MTSVKYVYKKDSLKSLPSCLVSEFCNFQCRAMIRSLWLSYNLYSLPFTNTLLITILNLITKNLNLLLT